jgi:hypothetical protein
VCFLRAIVYPKRHVPTKTKNKRGNEEKCCVQPQIDASIRKKKKKLCNHHDTDTQRHRLHCEESLSFGEEYACGALTPASLTSARASLSSAGPHCPLVMTASQHSLRCLH